MIINHHNLDAVFVPNDIRHIGHRVVGASAGCPHDVDRRETAFDQKLDAFVQIGFVLIGRVN